MADRYNTKKSIKDASNGLNELELNATLKTATTGFYHTLKRATPGDIYRGNHRKWLADSTMWKEKLKYRMLLADDAMRLDYLMDVDASLKKCMANIHERVQSGEEMSARKTLGWLYPYLVGMNDFAESAMIGLYENPKTFEKTKSRLDSIIERSITKNAFPRQVKVGTTNYTFYILDKAEPLPKERIREGHRKTWVGLNENANVFAESIDEIIQARRLKSQTNVSLEEVSYPFVVGRALYKYMKKMKEGSLAV